MKSKRLEALLTEIEKCNVLADIGTDHGGILQIKLSRQTSASRVWTRRSVISKSYSALIGLISGAATVWTY